MSDFTEVPVLDYALSTSEETKPAFLEKLKHALLEVGFLYVKNTGIDTVLVDNVVRLGEAFFDLPEEEKLRLEMKNCKFVLFAFRRNPSLVPRNQRNVGFDTALM